LKCQIQSINKCMSTVTKVIAYKRHLNITGCLSLRVYHFRSHYIKRNNTIMMKIIIVTV